MKTTNLSVLSKAMLAIVGLLFIGSLFVPLWRIELDAPQYPEGLVLQLHANKIAGEVDIINVYGVQLTFRSELNALARRI